MIPGKMAGAATMEHDSSPSSAPKCQVMIVDDSAVIRGFMARALGSDPAIEIVTTASNGEMALTALKRHEVDVIVLDIEMPVMDGLTALPKLVKAAPDTRVIMASTLTRQNASVSLRALAMGAADYIAKPSSSGELHSSESFRRDLIAKVKALGQTVKVPAARRGGAKKNGRAAMVEKRGLFADAPIVLRKPGILCPEILAIGASTGGPQALFELFKGLRGRLGNLPVFLTQHMPATFTTILAEHINQLMDIPCAEAVADEPVRKGQIYVAPGDFHMRVRKVSGVPTIKLDQEAPVNFCRPAVDPMLASLAEVYGAKILTVILTGMGKDGAKGGRAVIDAGGTVVAQDEETSVVWGMPGTAATAGLCSAVLPLSRIAPHLLGLMGRR